MGVKVRSEHIPDAIIEQWDRIMNLSIGEHVRLNHTYKENGEPCSLHKTNAMNVTRYDGGCYYLCFRCNEQGWVDDVFESPDKLAKKLKQKEEWKDMQRRMDEPMALPKDCISLSDNRVPNKASAFIKRFGLDDDDIKEHEIQYSPIYDRIIFPIYAHYFSSRSFATPKTLAGWTGRCYHPYTKEKRDELKRPKYITRKGDISSRLFYPCFNQWNDYMIFVEDIISAIKVCKATGVSTVALLTTSLPMNYVPFFNKSKCMVWLDYDAKQKANEIIMHFSTAGVKITLIETLNDPKMMSYGDISQIVAERITNFDS